jgi:hypothetical protein
MGINIKYFYLNTKMDRYEYMHLLINIIPQEIVNQYKLLLLVHVDYMYIKIPKGIYGLPQASIIANKKLKKRLAKFDYTPTAHTPGLWNHYMQPVQFSLVVDDFGIKCVGTDNAQHLIDAIQSLYKMATNWDGTLYCGITLKCLTTSPLPCTSSSTCFLPNQSIPPTLETSPSLATPHNFLSPQTALPISPPAKSPTFSRLLVPFSTMCMPSTLLFQ